MTLAVPDEIANSAQEIAAETGNSAESLLLQALYTHFPSVSPELQAEFDAWEELSAESMKKFEATEGIGWERNEPKFGQ